MHPIKTSGFHAPRLSPFIRCPFSSSRPRSPPLRVSCRLFCLPESQPPAFCERVTQKEAVGSCAVAAECGVADGPAESPVTGVRAAHRRPWHTVCSLSGRQSANSAANRTGKIANNWREKLNDCLHYLWPCLRFIPTVKCYEDNNHGIFRLINIPFLCLCT